MSADPLTNKIGEGGNVFGRYRSRGVGNESKRAASALREFVTRVAAIEEIEPGRSIQRCDPLPRISHQCGAADEQGKIVDGQYGISVDHRRMNDPVELSEGSTAIPIGVPPSHEPDDGCDQADDQENDRDP